MIKLICFTPWSTTLGSETDIILSASQVKSTVTATGCHLGPVGDEVLVAPPHADLHCRCKCQHSAKGRGCLVITKIELLDFLGCVNLH